MRRRKLFKVTVLYRSGVKVHIRCKTFKVTRSPFDGHITGIEWSEATPAPIHIGFNEIAAVWNGHV